MRRASLSALGAVLAAIIGAASTAALAQPAASAPSPAAKIAASSAAAKTAAPSPAAKTAASSAAAQPDMADRKGAEPTKADATKDGAAKADAAKKTDTAKAGDAAEADDDAGDALPPGHPGADDELPSGHPQVGANPHAATGKNQGMSDFFQPPEDTLQDDPSLPAGTLVVAIQDADGKPVPRTPFDLSVLRSSVAKGDSRESKTSETDENGSFRFEQLGFGAGTSYTVTVNRDKATFSLGAFALGAEVGKRAVLHVYEAASDMNSLLVGMQGILYVQLRQDSLAIEQLFQIFNLGRVAWTPDVTIPLPDKYKAFNKPEATDDMRFDEVKGEGENGVGGVALRGTVSPGRHEANYRYQIPLDETERQTIRIELPPRIAQMRVMAEASKAMTLEVGGFPPSQRTQNRDGKKILITEKQSSRADGGFKTIEITLGGLPTPSPSRWVALGLAGILVCGAVILAVRRRDDLDIDDDARQELLEARNALLDEFVELERAHKRGDVGPKTYARVRAALLDALARIVNMIESAPAPAKPEGSGRAGGSLKARSATAPRP